MKGIYVRSLALSVGLALGSLLPVHPVQARASVNYLGAGVVRVEVDRGSNDLVRLTFDDYLGSNTVQVEESHLGGWYLYQGAATVTAFEVVGVVTNTDQTIVPEEPIATPIAGGIKAMSVPGLSIFVIAVVVHLVRRGSHAGEGRLPSD